MSRTRFIDIAAIALAVAVVIGIGFALRPTETATVTVDPSTVQVDRLGVASTATNPSVLFIGDSYTAGNDTSELSYGCMAAVRLGWLCSLSAVPGTGYVSGNQFHRFVVNQHHGMSTSFVERIPHLAVQYLPDIVVLDGGRNDLFPPKDSVLEAMTATISAARQAWPEAKVVFIRPRFLAEPGENLGFNNAFMGQLRAAPATEGVLFIDPIQKLAGNNTSALLQDDGIHPNERGELAIASALAQSLTSLNFAGMT
jgi:lysophospholipase L1-like esterase